MACWLTRCLQSLFLILIGLSWQVMIGASAPIIGIYILIEWRAEGNFDLNNLQISNHLCLITLGMFFSRLLYPHGSHPPSVSLGRVQGKRKRNSYVRGLGWPVKSPLFLAQWCARLTSSSWSAAYVWTATRTPKSCPACIPSVRGEWSGVL